MKSCFCRPRRCLFSTRPGIYHPDVSNLDMKLYICRRRAPVSLPQHTILFASYHMTISSLALTLYAMIPFNRSISAGAIASDQES